MTDITSSFRGITTPTSELYTQIAQTGWQTTKVKFDKAQDAFVAEAKNPYGEKITRTGPNDRTALGNLLVAIMRRHHIRSAAQWKLGMWKTMFTDQLQSIAEAYAKAPIYDPKAAGCFMELAQDSTRRANVLRQQLEIEVVDDPEPYANAREMSDDIHNKKHFKVSRANSKHPVWSVQQNVDFRIVHDVLGHAVSGGDFGWQGENLACAAHFPLLTPTAQQALFTECFPGDTLIRTSDGLRPIDQIKIGEYVLTGDGTFQRVHAVFEKDHDGDLIELETTSTLGSIRVTSEHPFSTVVGNHPRKTKTLPCNRSNCNRQTDVHSFEWVEAGNLTDNNYVRSMTYGDNGMDISHLYIPPHILEGARLNARRGPLSFEVNDEFLWIAGLYLAEGSAGSGTLSFGLHKDEIEYQSRLKNYFESLGYGTNCRQQRNGNGIDFTVNSTSLAAWWPELFGKGCQNKKIPAVLLNLPNERLRPLVQGIMDGDGHYKRNVLFQTSPELALQVAEICFRLGGQPGILIRPKEGKKTIYELTEASADHRVSRRRGRRGHWELPNGNAVKITKAERVSFSGKVYDLGVEGDQTFVVQNIVVHNCIAQTAYAAFYRSFGPQKVALFPQFTDPSQAAENDPAHTGIHPSQSVAPTQMPAIPNSLPPEAHGAWPEGGVAPHEEGFGLTPVMNPTSKVAGNVLVDPNAGWESGIDPMTQETHGVGNAYLDHGDPLEAGNVMDTASLIDTKWHSLKNGDGDFDRDRAKQAVVNAFRVVLLSPRKDLRWNAIHYQNVAGIPASTDDPKAYWDTLESKRRAWNEAQGIDPNAHMIYFKFLKPFEAVIRAMHPDLSFPESKKKAEDILFDWWTEEQQRISAEDEDKPEEKQKTADELERRANEALAKRMQNFLKDKNDKTDVHEGESAQISLLGSNGERVEIKDPRFDGVQVWKTDEGYFVATRGKSKVYKSLEDIPDSAITKIRAMGAAGQYNLLTGDEALKYGAFMGTHLKAISKISKHSDELLDAALEDVKEHDGKGHHFRSKVLQLNISGAGPKVASFAWLLLQPMTSQLATIDTHMMDVLGHKYEKEMNNRDYFKFERELAAGRDAAGYGHVPLGAFQWGMWDHKRTGPGSHQDHSAMRVLNPISHQLVDWNSKGENLKGEDWHEQAPDWWKNTQPARDAVAAEFAENVAPYYAQGTIPYKNVDPESKVAAIESDPKKKNMKTLTDRGLSTPEVWAQFPDETEISEESEGSEDPSDNPWAGFPAAD